MVVKSKFGLACVKGTQRFLYGFLISFGAVDQSHASSDMLMVHKGPLRKPGPAIWQDRGADANLHATRDSNLHTIG